MAQTGFTPIQLYRTSTASAAPTAGNLAAGELSINDLDEKLYFKNSSGVVKLLASSVATGGSFTNLSYTGTLTGGTGVIAIGTNQIYKDAGGNVGIGTASPSTKLHLLTPSATITEVRVANSQSYASLLVDASGAAQLLTPGLTQIFNVNGAERVRIDSSGNVGIGTNSPGSKLVTASSAANSVVEIQNTSTAASTSKTSGLKFTGTDTVGTLKESGDIYVTPVDNNYVSSSMLFYTRGGDVVSERMRIDNSGNLLVGTTSAFATGSSYMYVRNDNAGRNGISVGNTQGSAATVAIRFDNSNGSVGSIITSGSTTSFNTSSDYRLKENIAPMTGALSKVAALKPVTYKWKSDGSNSQGFIAHELQEVVPQCVAGEKDAVDSEGKPIYQGIDTSFLVATLTAAIQELKAMVDAQAIEITALKSSSI